MPSPPCVWGCLNCFTPQNSSLVLLAFPSLVSYSTQGLPSSWCRRSRGLVWKTKLQEVGEGNFSWLLWRQEWSNGFGTICMFEELKENPDTDHWDWEVLYLWILDLDLGLRSHWSGLVCPSSYWSWGVCVLICAKVKPLHYNSIVARMGQD